jgi:hypothetical protein
VGQLLHPHEDDEFYRLYTAYWTLEEHMDDLMKLTGRTPKPYVLIAAHRRAFNIWTI